LGIVAVQPVLVSGWVRGMLAVSGFQALSPSKFFENECLPQVLADLSTPFLLTQKLIRQNDSSDWIEQFMAGM